MEKIRTYHIYKSEKLGKWIVRNSFKKLLEQYRRNGDTGWNHFTARGRSAYEALELTQIVGGIIDPWTTKNQP